MSRYYREDDVYEYDGYEEEEEEEGEEELSPEDRAQMDDGLVAVRKALKASPVPVNVTTKQIEDALWNSYYDVGKSVAFLTKKFAVKPKPTPATSGAKANPPAQKIAESFASFFGDMPWLKVPQDRQTTFIPPSIPIAGGLLGGAPSKLKALALRRKRKVDDKTALEPGQPVKVLGDGKREEFGVAPVAQKLQKLSVEGEVRASLSPSQSPIPRSAAPVASEDPDIPDYRVNEPSAFAKALFCAPEERRLPVQGRFINPCYAVNVPSHLPSLFDFSTPSPDDIALAAQAKAGKKKATPTNPPAASTPTAAMQGMKIQDSAPLPSSKNIDVVREWRHRQNPKKDACFVVVGHVDHGKSTMMGRLLLELGVVDERTIRKYKKDADLMGKSSFAYAWIMDSGSEERERGVTIDIATVPFETDTTSFTILDAPGHADFTPNMITGSTYADFAILVVDASTGAFESGLRGQTKQHTLLLRSMGVNRVVVAVNKMDATGWDRERFDEICDQMRGIMKGLRFRLDKVSFIPVSGLQADNLAANPTNPKASWYAGPTLIEELETVQFPTEEMIRKPLRMDIVDFTTKDFLGNMAVTGRLRQGHMQVGDAVAVQPSGQKAYIKGLLFGKDSKDYVVAGQYVRAYLSHIDPMHVRIGDVICSPAEPIPVIKTFQMKTLAFEPLMPSTVEVVRGRMQARAQMRPISILDKRDAHIVKLHPQLLRQGEFGRLDIRFEKGAKLPLESGQRVVIRDTQGKPLAAGLLD